MLKKKQKKLHDLFKQSTSKSEKLIIGKLVMMRSDEQTVYLIVVNIYYPLNYLLLIFLAMHIFIFMSGVYIFNYCISKKELTRKKGKRGGQ